MTPLSALRSQINETSRDTEKSLLAALDQQLGELEGELEAALKPNPDDYRSVHLYEADRERYRAEIKRIWDKIHELVRLWPPGV